MLMHFSLSRSLIFMSCYTRQQFTSVNMPGHEIVSKEYQPRYRRVPNKMFNTIKL